MNPRLAGAAAAGAIVALVAAGMLAGEQAEAPLPATTAQALPLPLPALAAAPAATPAEPAAATPGDAPDPPCPNGRLQVQRAGVAERACIVELRSAYSGSLRTDVARADGPSGWTLHLRSAAQQVVSARLVAAGGPAPAAYACSAGGCGGLVIAPADGAGVRRIEGREVTLRQEAGMPVRMDAAIVLRPDARQQRLGCEGSGELTVLDAQGAASTFCAGAGAGFERAADGSLRYLFDSLEGRRLVVALGPDGRLASVRWNEFTCVAPGCSGVAMSTAGPSSDPGAERRFDFTGTQLERIAGGVAAQVVLGGSIRMPEQ